MTRAPLVLLPGLLCDAALWAPQVAALSDIAEPRVADLARDDDIGAMAARVLAEAPPRFALAGLSMGGYVSFEVMRRAPERVTHLALLDTSARPDTPERAQVRRDFIALARGGGFRGVTPRLLPQWVHASRMSDPDFVEAVTSMTLRVGRDAFIRQQTAILGRPDSRPGLSRIRVPTLVLCGRQDQATPVEVAREIAADIEGARLVVVEECGHLATLERPAEVSAAMRAWLST
ncbi:MAG: alpha/beta fold hydrolase [Alphaproteobacteria bacterium]|nr:alpha/beta fold hydrolase [Alphaproteobacteria bacterium]